MTRFPFFGPSLTALLAVVALAPLATPDTIYKSNGERLTDVTVESEGLAGVVYKAGRGAAVTLSVEAVDRIDYERSPKLLVEAAGFAAEGDVAGARQVYADYLDGQLDSKSDERRFPWAAPYAARRALELARTEQDWAGVITLADTIINRFPDSRHVPDAFLAKADAQAVQGARADASATLGAFAALVQSKSLPTYFGLEARLGQVMMGAEMTPAKRLEALEKVAAEVRTDFPRLYLRALVARGETHLQIAFDDAGQRTARIASARALFEEAEAASGADTRTRAGAKAGLAECLFLGANPETDQAQLQRARDLYLRVAVLYPEEAAYAARSLYFAARCFDLLGTPEDKIRAQRLYREVQRKYEGTTWATEARNQRR